MSFVEKKSQAERVDSWISWRKADLETGVAELLRLAAGRVEAEDRQVLGRTGASPGERRVS